jgi:ribosomal protein S18 acetylase RimI-like enzyme
MTALIRPIQLDDAAGFRECLDAVARERLYLAQVEAPPLERVCEFVANALEQGAAQYVAVVDGRIVGWCDVIPHWAYALKHVGTLGLAVHASHRGQGLGRALMTKTLDQALKNGVFRVTLEAREDNTRAIRLYEQMGFKHEYLAPGAMCFDGVYYAGVKMALLQGPLAAA